MEELLMNVVRQMAEYLDEEQLDRLQNVLYIQFHGKKLQRTNMSCRTQGLTEIHIKLSCLLPAKKSVAGRIIP